MSRLVYLTTYNISYYKFATIYINSISQDGDINRKHIYTYNLSAEDYYYIHRSIWSYGHRPCWRQ